MVQDGPAHTISDHARIAIDFCKRVGSRLLIVVTFRYFSFVSINTEKR